MRVFARSPGYYGPSSGRSLSPHRLRPAPSSAYSAPLLSTVPASGSSPFAAGPRCPPIGSPPALRCLRCTSADSSEPDLSKACDPFGIRLLPNTERTGIMPMVRTSPQDLHAEAVQAVAEALTATGLAVQLPRAPGGPDLVIDGPEGVAVAEVKALSVAGVDRIRNLIRRTTPKDRADLVVVVGDELMGPARELLRRQGWGYLDRRGELWLRGPGLFVHDTTLGARSRHRPASDRPIRGAVGAGVALYLLMHPREGGLSVRRLAAAVGAAPSSVHDAVKLLRQHALIDRAGEPLVPELFDTLVQSWASARVAVGRRPEPEEDAVLSGDVAAALLGAPVVAGGAELPDVYVASPAQLSRAVRTLGECPYDARAATVALAPTPLAARTGSDGTRWRDWPVAHSVVVALDLAQDRSRGREILSQWSPEGVVRVW